MGVLPGIGGFRTSAVSPVLTFRSVSASTSSLTTHTLSSMAVGAAAANRFIIALMDWTQPSGAATAAPTLVTIGGATATQLTYYNPASSTDMGLAVYGALLPTGTTASVVVTFAASQRRVGCALFSLAANAMNVVNVVSSFFSGTTDVSQAVTVPSGGAGVGFCQMGDGGGAYHASTWSGTGVTEVCDQTTGGSNALTAGTVSQSATVVVSNTSDGGNAFLYVAWEPS